MEKKQLKGLKNTQELGNLGEKIAEDYLKRKGYKILDKNYKLRLNFSPQSGEVDIIAKNQKNNIIVFSEVKTLNSNYRYFSPEEKVNFTKKKKIIKTAESWLLKNKISLDSEWQIDVISIRINPETKKAKIQHFPNAFFN